MRNVSGFLQRGQGGTGKGKPTPKRACRPGMPSGWVALDWEATSSFWGGGTYKEPSSVHILEISESSGLFSPLPPQMVTSLPLVISN